MDIITTKNGATINLNNKLIPSVIVSADQRITLLGEDVVNMTVKSAEPIEFDIGGKINIYGRTYSLNQLPQLKKKGARKFEYSIIFEGVQYELIDVQWLLPIDAKYDSFTGDLDDYVNILIDNANRVFPGMWNKGTAPADTETKTLTYTENNCLEVLQNICKEYKTEFEITQNNGIRTINLKKAGVTFPYTFSYGRSGGLYELTRQNIDAKNVVTRLYVYGGSNNLGSNYRYTKLCLPLKEKNVSFIENSAAVEAFGIKENTKTFDKIYPKRVGEVTAGGSKYYSFIDNTMSFDLNEKEEDGKTTKWLINGVAGKIKVTSGNLAGYEFEIHKYDNETKEIQVVPFTDENGMKFPSETSAAFQFKVGDKYIFTDINLPDTYKTDAETDLQTEGEEYYSQYCQPQVQYSLSIDQNFIKQFAGELTIVNLFAVGDYIQVEDADIGLDKSIRITAFTRDLLQPYKYNITLGDSVKQSLITRVISDLQDIDNAIKINDLLDPAKARRNWRSAQEVLASVFDPEGNYYSEKIKPLSIETSMLAVGAKSMQFVLQNTLIEANYEGNKNAVKVAGGTLAHYTISENTRYWSLSSATTALISDSEAYNIYGKCQKDGNAGSIVFSTSQIKVDEDPNFYHFLIGVINSVDSGTRSIYLTYGSSTINGRFIRTGRIQSGDGSTYFDLDNNEIGGNIKFLNSSGDLEDIEKVKLYIQYSADGYNWHDVYASSDKYMRQKNGASGAWSSPILIKGGDGRGVSHIKSAFTYSPSNTSPNPNQGWHYDMSNIARPEGYFLWMRDDIFYTDGTDNSTDGRLVVEGRDGKDGVDGDDAFADPAIIAKINEAAAITDQLGTAINGGLITSVTMLLREAYTAKITAGISGIQGAQNKYPAFWAGGSHAEALAGLANIIFQHDGSGKVGNMHLKDNKFSSKDGRVEIDGATNTISLKDPNLEVKTIIHPNNIPSIGDYFDTGGSYNEDLSSLNSNNFTGTDIRSITIGGSSSETHELTIAGFDIETYLSVYLGGGDPNSIAEAATIVELLKDGVVMLRLAEAIATSYSDKGGATAYGGMQSKALTVSGNATYTVMVMHSIQQPQGGATATSYAKISGMTTMTTGKIINRSEIGSNGMVIATSSLNYTYDVGTLFQIRRGNIGFQVTSSNVKKSTNMYATTPTWTNI